MKGAKHVYAVVRVDLYLEKPIPNGITVKEILPTLEEAKKEVERLMALNKDKNVLYFWQTTRFFPDGRPGSADSGGDVTE